MDSQSPELSLSVTLDQHLKGVVEEGRERERVFLTNIGLIKLQGHII